MLRPTPAPRVEGWLAVQESTGTFLTAISEAELRYGVALLPAGRRRAILADAVDNIIRVDFRGRVLPFGSAAAVAYAAIAADRRAAGRPISQPDCQIAAIARAAGAAVATRNVMDFEGCGIGVIDPWTAG